MVYNLFKSVDNGESLSRMNKIVTEYLFIFDYSKSPDVVNHLIEDGYMMIMSINSL